VSDGIVGPLTWRALESPGAAPAEKGPGGLAGPGEMELVGPGPEMEKSGAAEGGEAALPGEAAVKKEGELKEAELEEGAAAEAKLLEPEPAEKKW
jgi:hypothetical protein